MNTSSELAPVMTTQSTKNFEREQILTLFSGKKNQQDLFMSTHYIHCS